MRTKAPTIRETVKTIDPSLHSQDEANASLAAFLGHCQSKTKDELTSMTQSKLELMANNPRLLSGI